MSGELFLTRLIIICLFIWLVYTIKTTLILLKFRRIKKEEEMKTIKKTQKLLSEMKYQTNKTY